MQHSHSTSVILIYLTLNSMHVRIINTISIHLRIINIDISYCILIFLNYSSLLLCLKHTLYLFFSLLCIHSFTINYIQYIIQVSNFLFCIRMTDRDSERVETLCHSLPLILRHFRLTRRLISKRNFLLYFEANKQ